MGFVNVNIPPQLGQRHKFKQPQLLGNCITRRKCQALPKHCQNIGFGKAHLRLVFHKLHKLSLGIDYFVGVFKILGIVTWFQQVEVLMPDFPPR